MDKGLRLRLTRQFVVLFIALYFFGGALAMLMFNWHLDDALDDELTGLSEEILPSIEYELNQPTLRTWAKHAENQHLALPGTIQLYSSRRELLETYGSKGINALNQGTTMLPAGGNVRSMFVGITQDGNHSGFLQIQVSTRHRDRALYGIITVMVMVTPVLALAVAVCGSSFAGNALRPVEQTVLLLRQFVADAGHEINTPIAVIEASVQTLEELFLEKELPTDVLEIITRASRRMKELGDSLLLLSRMETPQLVAPKVPLDLSEIVSPVLEECRQIAKSKNIKLECSPIPNKKITAHLEALQRMLLNLLANALRYTDPGGSVMLVVAMDGDKVIMEVQDTGIGIPAESLCHLFERFYRVDQSRSRAGGGSGLGLSIVKAIVDSHGGSISATSEVGKGSNFSVRLPINGGDPKAALLVLH